MNVVERGLHVFDRIIIACNQGERKKILFSLDERVKMLQTIFSKEKKIEIDTFEGLLVHYLARKKITTILRGIRTVEDFEYEHRMTLANRTLDQNVETVFMLTDGNYSHMSSSLIKEIATLQGNVANMVPPAVMPFLKKKIPNTASKNKKS